LVCTTCFFAAHATASAWVGHRATTARAQAAACYTLAYYVGSSLFGWLGGFLYDGPGWTAVVGYVVGLCAIAASLAILVLRRRPGRTAAAVTAREAVREANYVEPKV